MGNDERFEETIAAMSAEMAAGRKTTAYNAYDFLGNLGIKARFFDDSGPDEIARRVRRCMEDNIPMFERQPGSREFVVVKDRLIPLKGMRETYDITLRDIEKVYLAAQEPLTLEELKPLLDPLFAGVKRFRESEYVADGG